MKETQLDYLYLNSENNMIYADLTSFIDEKTEICKMVDDNYLNKLISVDLKFREDTAELIDRYILHTIEEVYENYIEGVNFSGMPICLENNVLAYSDLDKFNEELIDIVSYIISLRTLLNKIVVKKILVIDFDITTLDDKTKLPLTELRLELFNVVINLINLRILYPERKWQYHHPVNQKEPTMKDMVERFNKTYSIINNILISLVKLYIKANYTRCRCNIRNVLYDFNELFYRKNKNVIKKINDNN